ncbi:MAG: hypothetical protein QG632_296 [Candidatus Dependentiae bacterium]|nr:hypothetical protein [Candidatus Dependentiae bacterium]
MWSVICKTIKAWWHQSSLSSWYVKRMIRQYAIDLTQFTLTTDKVPTLAQFMLRRYRTKPLAPRNHERLILSPVAGVITKQDAHHITIQMHLHHYHRIHLPIAGTVTHYTRAPYTSTTIHISAPDGLIISLTIATTSEQHATVLRYNPQRNYHLQGTEIGYVYATDALVTLQSNRPCLYSLKKNEDLSCNTALGELSPIHSPSVTHERTA